MSVVLSCAARHEFEKPMSMFTRWKQSKWVSWLRPVKRWFVPPPPPPPLPPPILLPPSSPKPWPQYSDIGCHLFDRLNVFLFLQDRYLAGVWEATKVLVQNLVEVNRERRRLTFTLG